MPPVVTVCSTADQVLSTPELSFLQYGPCKQMVALSYRHRTIPPTTTEASFATTTVDARSPFDEQLGTYLQQDLRIERMSIDRSIANGLIREIPSAVRRIHRGQSSHCQNAGRTGGDHRVFSLAWWRHHGFCRPARSRFFMCGGDPPKPNMMVDFQLFRFAPQSRTYPYPRCSHSNSQSQWSESGHGV